MSVLLQISDTHFGTEQMPVMSALLQLHAQLQPDVVVVSGDITQRAHRLQFRAAQQFFAQLGARKLLVIPGNHDIPLFNVALRVLAPYANYSRAFGRDLQPEFESADLLVICINTTRAQRHTVGEVSAQQIAEVAQRLATANPAQLRVVVTHQPVHVITVADKRNVLRGHQAAIEAWAEAGADIILGGHIHLPYVRALHPLPATPARTLWAVQAGTALSTRIRNGKPNSVNVVHYKSEHDKRDCSVEQWDFDMRSRTFCSVLSTPLDIGQHAVT
jgi:3',5'-cyclic AMP phosphodiesterase CpdA